jgi:hypothetical protein
MKTMDDKDMEERLRGVVKGPQPEAPASLHRFLRDLPETEAAHHHGPIGRLRGALDRAPGLFAPHPYLRRAQMGFGVAMAIVIGVAGAGLYLNLLNAPAAPAASGSPGQTGPWLTPRRSTDTRQLPVQASLGVANVSCVGLPGVANENMALPTQAIITPKDGKYLGVTGGVFGSIGMVRSSDGLYWDWSPPTEIDPAASTVTSIASNGLDNGVPMIVVTGGVQGVDGTTDGRIWLSSDDGATWTKTRDETQFKGVTVQQVAYSSSTGQWIALGWAATASGLSAHPVSAWRSVDGLTWTHVAAPIKGESALLVATAAGFVLSGTPLDATGAINQPPIWHTADGTSWDRSTATDNTGQLMGPLVSVTVTGYSGVAAISASPDGSSKQLVYSGDGGMTWYSIKPDDSLPYANKISHITSLMFTNTEIWVATAPYDSGAHFYMSKDMGLTWTRLVDTTVGGPTGTMLIEVESSYHSGDRRLLVYGEPGSGFGIWLIKQAS